MSIIVAPPAMPAHVAMWPAWRPITSTTMTRSCDSAVVCRRSIASIAICTAVSNPKVSSVPDRSLSIVFGTPTTLHAGSNELGRHTQRVLAADGDQRVDAELRRGWSRHRSTPPSILNGLVRDEPSTVPPAGSVPRKVSTDKSWCRPSITPFHPSRKPITSSP